MLWVIAPPSEGLRERSWYPGWLESPRTRVQPYSIHTHTHTRARTYTPSRRIRFLPCAIQCHGQRHRKASQLARDIQSLASSQLLVYDNSRTQEVMDPLRTLNISIQIEHRQSANHNPVYTTRMCNRICQTSNARLNVTDWSVPDPDWLENVFTEMSRSVSESQRQIRTLRHLDTKCPE